LRGLQDCAKTAAHQECVRRPNWILIADDSQKFRAAAAELLAARGLELIEEAADGNEALSAIARACPTEYSST